MHSQKEREMSSLLRLKGLKGSTLSHAVGGNVAYHFSAVLMISRLYKQHVIHRLIGAQTHDPTLSLLRVFCC